MSGKGKKTKPKTKRAPAPAVAAAKAATKAAKAAATKGRGRAPGQRNFSNEEKDCITLLAEQIIPISAEEWKTIHKHFTARFPLREADHKGLKKKFQSLAEMKVPTGDPLCPSWVRRAKHVSILIQEKSDAQIDAELPDEALGVDVKLPPPLEWLLFLPQSLGGKRSHPLPPLSLPPGLSSLPGTLGKARALLI